MLILNLKPIFKARGIDRPYSFLVKSGFTYHTASKLTNPNTKIFRLNHIEKLCELLICEPNDLLAWLPTKAQILQEKHPLEKLKFDNKQQNWKDLINKLPYQELKALVKDKANNLNTEKDKPSTDI